MQNFSMMKRLSFFFLCAKAGSPVSFCAQDPMETKLQDPIDGKQN
jgi:hypothetical protein